MFRFEQNGNLQLCIRSVSGVLYIHQIHQKSEPLTGFVRLYSKKETRQIKIRCQNLPEEPTDGFQGQILYAPVQSGKNQCHSCRKIIVWIVFINEQAGDPEQCNGIDNDAQWQIQYSQKGKYSHDHIHGKIPDQTFVVAAHIPAAQERQRGKWSDHGVFHAEKEICNKKYQGDNNGRSDSTLQHFFLFI